MPRRGLGPRRWRVLWAEITPSFIVKPRFAQHLVKLACGHLIKRRKPIPERAVCPFCG